MLFYSFGYIDQGLPSRFCEDHLPKSTTDMVLEDEEGTEFEAVYISKRSGLSGGWRAFALDYKLDDGDALVFELIGPTRFKVYIIRAFKCSTPEDDRGCDAGDTAKKATKQRKKDGNQLTDSTGSTADDPSVASGRRRSSRLK